MAVTAALSPSSLPQPSTGRLEVSSVLALTSIRSAWRGNRYVDCSNFGDVNGTIRNDLRYPFVPNNVRRHRLISISYISQILCHSTARWCGMERDGVGGNRKVSDNPYYAGA